jgi:hypothetical protein
MIERVSSSIHVDGAEEHCLQRRFRGIRFHQHYRYRPNMDYSRLTRRRAFASSSHQRIQPAWACCEERERERLALLLP